MMNFKNVIRKPVRKLFTKKKCTAVLRVLQTLHKLLRITEACKLNFKTKPGDNRNISFRNLVLQSPNSSPQKQAMRSLNVEQLPKYGARRGRSVVFNWYHCIKCRNNSLPDCVRCGQDVSTIDRGAGTGCIAWLNLWSSLFFFFF